MRRILFILPHFLGDPECESSLRQKLPSMKALTEAGSVFKITPIPPIETPEALFLGMTASEGQMRQGPLTVSALGADPPDRSTHFHLSLGSLENDTIAFPQVSADTADLSMLFSRLDTRTMTTLVGEGTDHALVWEDIGDLGTTSMRDAEGKRLRDVMPEGDNEKALRRFIDDSVNLLAEQGYNLRRIEEGLPPLNVLWPWGEGPRGKVPNLMLRRGEIAAVESSSMRLAGLTRLSGYRHEDRRLFGRPDEPAMGSILKRSLKRGLSIVVLSAESYPHDDEDKRAWFVEEFDRIVAKKLIDSLAQEVAKVTILMPGEVVGIGLTTSFPLQAGSDLPFDERLLEEPKLPKLDVNRAVEAAISLRM